MFKIYQRNLQNKYLKGDVIMEEPKIEIPTQKILLQVNVDIKNQLSIKTCLKQKKDLANLLLDLLRMIVNQGDTNIIVPK